MYLFDEPISPSSILLDLEAGIHLHGVCSRSRDERQCESQELRAPCEEGVWTGAGDVHLRVLFN